MTYTCAVCKTNEMLLQTDTKQPDFGHPLYRKAKLINRIWAVVDWYCGPKCSLDAYEADASRDAG